MSCEKIFQQIITRGYFKVSSRLCVNANRVLSVSSPFDNVLVDYLDEKGKTTRSILFEKNDDDILRKSGAIW